MDPDPDKNAQEFEELRRESQRHLIEFLNSDLQLGCTFAEVAATERDLGNLEHFEHSKRDAIKAVDTIRKFLYRIAVEEVRLDFERRVSELERNIAAL